MDQDPILPTLAQAIEACFCVTSADVSGDLSALVASVLGMPDAPALPHQPNSAALHKLRIDHPGLTLPLDLVYGGATRVKEYVFEAPKLPEIRGASAALDYVTNILLPRLWEQQVGDLFQQKLGLDHEQSKWQARACVIYAGGGNFLAVAPTGMGQQLAPDIERLYADWTLTATSAAVWAPAILAELRYGRLRPAGASEAWYWWDEAARDWDDAAFTRQFDEYYYQGAIADPNNRQERFFQRKTFGELVAQLAMGFYRRREERAYQGPPRNPVHYPLLPWDERCETSGTRPAS